MYWITGLDVLTSSLELWRGRDGLCTSGRPKADLLQAAHTTLEASAGYHTREQG